MKEGRDGERKGNMGMGSEGGREGEQMNGKGKGRRERGRKEMGGG